MRNFLFFECTCVFKNVGKSFKDGNAAFFEQNRIKSRSHFWGAPGFKLTKSFSKLKSKQKNDITRKKGNERMRKRGHHECKIKTAKKKHLVLYDGYIISEN